MAAVAQCLAYFSYAIIGQIDAPDSAQRPWCSSDLSDSSLVIVPADSAA
jgi:hypothetical protein